MNQIERVLDDELVWLLDRLAATVPEGTAAAVSLMSPTLGARLREADLRVAEIRALLLSDYARWRRALDDLESLWALASWRSAAPEETTEQTAILAA